MVPGARILMTVALASLTTAAAAQSDLEPLPPAAVAFVQQLFNAVPAPSIAARLPGLQCKKQMLPSPMAQPGGGQLVGMYLCDIDFGCEQTGTAPVWFDNSENFGFGPDSAERLVAMYCPESIADPQRRKQLTDKLN